jgi:ribonuclease P protein component
VLAADQRLRDSNAFRRTVRFGRRAGGAALVVHLLVEDGGVSQLGPRVGLVVSKAVGNSVVRNRVKRRLRHVVRDYLSDLPGSASLVIRALPAAARLSSSELGVDLARCLDRVGRGTPAAQTGAAS